MEMVFTSQARAHGMSVREIHRNLQSRPIESRAGSFSTVYKCLRSLETKGFVHRSPVTKKYMFDEIGLSLFDRDLITEAILQSNILGGGRLSLHEISEDEIRFPEKKPEVFVAADIFIRASLKGIDGRTDEGVLFIETLEGFWPEKQREASDNAKTNSTTYRLAPHFINLFKERQNATRTAINWVNAIWNYAQEKGLVGCDLTLKKASNEDLERIWNEIFPSARVKTIVVTEFIEPKKLLEWWITSKHRHNCASCYE